MPRHDIQQFSTKLHDLHQPNFTQSASSAKYFQAGKPLFNQFDVPSECAFSCGLANCASCILRRTPVQRAFEPPLQRAQAGMHLLLSKFLVLQCYSFSEKIVLYTCTYFSSSTLFEFLSFFLKDSKKTSHPITWATGRVEGRLG